MSVVEELRQLGGVGTRAQLEARCPRRAVDRAIASGDIIRISRGTYALPDVDTALERARARHGVLCLTSAALHHGWAVKTLPDLPHVLVDKRRRLTGSQRSGVVVHRANLHADEIDGRGVVTSRDKTLEMCLRVLPPDEALCVADSALRSGFSPDRLAAIARDARGPGSAQLREVAGLADDRAANPFESVLRWLCQHVEGLRVVPQKVVTGRDLWAQPDLVDPDLMLVLEADSFEWHGGRSALRKDARRYNALVAEGWLVLRFSWEDVMFEPAAVRDVLSRTVRLRRGDRAA